MNVNGKLTMATGGASGIGLALCTRLPRIALSTYRPSE
jgi:short-subunit dehydrogenase involved in D-alanine esterification of teichoic acids